MSAASRLAGRRSRSVGVKRRMLSKKCLSGARRDVALADAVGGGLGVVTRPAAAPAGRFANQTFRHCKRSSAHDAPTWCRYATRTMDAFVRPGGAACAAVAPGAWRPGSVHCCLRIGTGGPALDPLSSAPVMELLRDVARGAPASSSRAGMRTCRFSSRRFFATGLVLNAPTATVMPKAGRDC